MPPLVSVGLPFYNNASTLDEAIRSVFAQTLSDWELILLDDGSTDGSVHVARRIKDSRVRVISDRANRGLPARLNEITALARGRYIARMDADDMMHPERLERQVAFLAECPDIALVGTGLYSIDDTSNPVGVRYPLQTELSPKFVLAHSIMIHVSVMGPAEWFWANQYDETFRRLQDRELWVRTYATTRFANLPRPLMFVREGGNVTAEKYASSSKAHRTILRMYGPSMIGHRRTLQIIGISYTKEWAYRSLCLIGRQDLLVNRRNAELTSEQREEAAAALNQIRHTPIPLEELANTANTQATASGLPLVVSDGITP